MLRRLAHLSVFAGLLACGSKSGLGLPDEAPSSPPPALTGETSAAVVVPPDDGVDESLTPDLVFVAPYRGGVTPSRGRVSHVGVIRDVDVAITVDTTGSMMKPIAALKEGIADVMTALQGAFPSVGLAVVDFRDVGDPWVVKVRSTVDTDVRVAQRALADMIADGGGDEPEADLQAIYYAITGAHVSSLAANVPPAGRFGGVDYRLGALPVVANVTDARFHDPSGAIDSTEVASALTSVHARFVAVTETHFAAAHADLEAIAEKLSDATASNVPVAAFRGSCGEGSCCTGVNGAPEPPRGPGGSCRLDFHSYEGVGVGPSLVDGVRALAIGTRFDVLAVPVNDPANAPIDATRFVAAVRAVDEGDPTRGCAPHRAEDRDGDGVRETFVDAIVGTPLCFEVVAAPNEIASHGTYDVVLEILGLPGSIRLDRRLVRFVVPS